MFLPLVDILRCPHVHDETWLVATIERAEERDIVDGMLGCPICLAEYPIRAGVVYFDEHQSHASEESPSDEAAVRLAAGLDLTEPRMTALLHARWGAHAQLVRGLSPAHLLLLNGPPSMASGDGVSKIVAASAPLAQGSVDAVAVDATAIGDAGILESLIRALKYGGRMLAPASIPLPDGFAELARDEEIWVARLNRKETVSAPIALKRRDANNP